MKLLIDNDKKDIEKKLLEMKILKEDLDELFIEIKELLNKNKKILNVSKFYFYTGLIAWALFFLKKLIFKI
jgi:hypothetical protein